MIERVAQALFLFSLEDAKTLRGLLPPIQEAVANSAPQPAPRLDTRKRRYLEHYSLDFDDLQSSIDHSIGSFKSAGFTLVCQVFRCKEKVSRGTAFIIHGYFDHTGIYKNLIRFCLERNFSVVMFDLPGHGLSSGKRASIDSFSRYTQAISDCSAALATSELIKPWHLIGQSLGGAIILDLLLEPISHDIQNFDKAVLLGPLLRPKGWVRGRILFFIVKKFAQRLERKFSINSNDDVFLNFLKEGDKLQPKHLSIDWIEAMVDFQKRFRIAPISNREIHIIQGSDDGTVDWEYNIPQFKNKMPNATIHMIDKARHHLVNESAEYRDQIFAEIEKII